MRRKVSDIFFSFIKKNLSLSEKKYESLWRLDQSGRANFKFSWRKAEIGKEMVKYLFDFSFLEKSQFFFFGKICFEINK